MSFIIRSNDNINAAKTWMYIYLFICVTFQNSINTNDIFSFHRKIFRTIFSDFSQFISGIISGSLFWNSGEHFNEKLGYQLYVLVVAMRTIAILVCVLLNVVHGQIRPGKLWIDVIYLLYILCTCTLCSLGYTVMVYVMPDPWW